jgi:hypothetical protein
MAGALATAALIDFGMQAVVGAYSIAVGSETFYDLTGSLAFIVVALTSFR